MLGGVPPPPPPGPPPGPHVTHYDCTNVTGGQQCTETVGGKYSSPTCSRKCKAAPPPPPPLPPLPPPPPKVWLQDDWEYGYHRHLSLRYLNGASSSTSLLQLESDGVFPIDLGFGALSSPYRQLSGASSGEIYAKSGLIMTAWENGHEAVPTVSLPQTAKPHRQPATTTVALQSVSARSCPPRCSQAALATNATALVFGGGPGHSTLSRSDSTTREAIVVLAAAQEPRAAPTLFLVDENEATAPHLSRARVRVINAVPAAAGKPPVAVTLSSDSGSYTHSFEPLAFTRVSQSVEVLSGSYKLRSAADGPNGTAFSVTLKQGGLYSLYLFVSNAPSPAPHANSTTAKVELDPLLILDADFTAHAFVPSLHLHATPLLPLCELYSVL